MSADDGSSKKRADAQPSKFLNLTSMEWATSYRRLRASSRALGQPGHQQEPGRARRRQVVLGQGQEAGAWDSASASAGHPGHHRRHRRVLLPAHRRRRDRAARDSACQAMMRDSAQYFIDNDEMPERSGYSPWSSGWQQQQQQAAEQPADAATRLRADEWVAPRASPSTVAPARSSRRRRHREKAGVETAAVGIQQRLHAVLGGVRLAGLNPFMSAPGHIQPHLRGRRGGPAAEPGASA